MSTSGWENGGKPVRKVAIVLGVLGGIALVRSGLLGDLVSRVTGSRVVRVR